MSDDKLNNKKIAVLMTDGFEELEFTEPKKALENKGASIDVISLKPGKIKAWDHDHWSNEYAVDKTIDEVSSDEYDGLLLPGGVMNPDNLRADQKAVNFVKGFFAEGKPIAAICHGPWTLIETGALPGRKVTSYHTLQTDLKNAGAEWVDEEVVVDQGLVTSRNPDDLPAFNRKMVEEFYEGIHQEQNTL